MSKGTSRNDIETFVLELARSEGVGSPRLDDRLTDLGIDSLALADQMGALERRFHVQMDADIADVDTLRELVDYLEARC